MLFNSYEFIFEFLPISVVSYWLVIYKLGSRSSIIWLGLTSYIFFLIGERHYPYLLIASIAFNYGIGARLFANPAKPKVWLIAGVVGDLGLLVYFKYWSFLTTQLVALGVLDSPAAHKILPVGISFYTFTQIAFLIDAYRHEANKKNEFWPYLLFVTLFPHLIAGPILHHGEMIPQFLQKRKISIRDYILPGLIMFTIGLAKKTLIADTVSSISTDIFSAANSGTSLGLIEAWVGALSYTIQIYFDFSGYSDMALGIAKMLGIKLPVNFNSPYKATSIVDFWRRWHITLSRFLRDYLYIALGGNRHGAVRRYINLFATMVIGGFWHGAAWTFIIWGALHGFALAVVHGWNKLSRAIGIGQLPKWLARLITFASVVVFWVPFRADSLLAMQIMWRGMFGLNGIGLPDYNALIGPAHALHLAVVTVHFQATDGLLIAAGILIAWFAPNSQTLLAASDPGLDTEGYHALSPPEKAPVRLSLSFVILSALLLGLAIRMISTNSEFIYFRF